MASAPLLLPPYNCLTINFFVLFSATTGSNEKWSSTKRSTKGEKFPKMGHLPNVTPSPRVQQPKSRSQGSNMPTVEEDIFGSWDEIERGERQIRMELNAVAPGDPILGPIDQLPGEEFPDLPFHVFSTRFGGVYHLSRSCRHLASVNTGLAKESKWCSRCRRSAYQNGSVPALGATLFLRAYGSAAHSDMRCPTALGSNHLQLCTACLETKNSTA